MADTAVDLVVQSATGEYNTLHGPYWVSPSIGVVVFSDNLADLSFARTTDGGASWDKTVIFEGTMATSACWYDQETPGSSGNLLHITWMDTATDEVYYQALDISDGSLGTKRTAGTPVAVYPSSDRVKISITKAVSDYLYIAYASTNGALQYSDFIRSVDDGVNWTSRTEVFEAEEGHIDAVRLAPAATGDDNDVCAVFWDRTAVEISLKMYDSSEDSWAETSVDAGATYNSTYQSFDVAVRHSDSHILLTYHSAIDNAGDDLRAWDLAVDDINSPTITQKTNVFTDQAEAAQVALLINQQTSDVYLVYIKGGTWRTSSDIVYHLSQDGMGSWGGETSYSEAAADDLRVVSAGRSVGDAGGRFMPVFYNDDLEDIFVNLVNDVEIAAPAADPAQSTITAATSPIYADGVSTSIITVQLVDTNGDDMTTGGETVTLDTDLGSLSVVTDVGDGTYTAQLTAGETNGTATITGTVNGEDIVDTASVVMDIALGELIGSVALLNTLTGSISLANTLTGTVGLANTLTGTVVPIEEVT